MDDFNVYFNLGLEHITDLKGFDHILFIIALCTVYRFPDWKKLLFLVTAFTLGHSLTLALAVLKVINVNSEWVEFLIPVTIIITAITNLRKPQKGKSAFKSPIYWLAAGFGLIHGMGFSSYLRSLLGKDNNIVSELFAFNIGLEVGQLAIVLITLLLTFIVTDLAKIKHQLWKTWLSGLVAGAAMVLMNQKWFF